MNLYFSCVSEIKSVGQNLTLDTNEFAQNAKGFHSDGSTDEKDTK